MRLGDICCPLALPWFCVTKVELLFRPLLTQRVSWLRAVALDAGLCRRIKSQLCDRGLESGPLQQ